MQHSTKREEIPFVEITDKEIELEKMLNGMKASGMSGSLYSTAELQDMKGGVRDEDDEDEVSRTSINENGDTVIRF